MSPSAIQIEPQRDVRVVLVGVHDVDITERILEISDLHEALEAESGQFFVPNMEITLDDFDDFYSYYNGMVKTDPVRLMIYGENAKVLFDGDLLNPDMAVDPGQKLLKLEAEHVLRRSADVLNQMSTGQDDWLGNIRTMHPSSWGEISRADIAIDLSLVQNYDNYSEQKLTYYDLWLGAPYFYEGMSELEFIGDWLRSLCAWMYIDDNCFYIRDRKSILNARPYLVKHDWLIDADEVVPWKRQRKGVKIESLFALSQDLKTITTEGFNSNNQNVNITANMMSNLYRKFDTGYNISYDNMYPALSKYILGQYESWYVRNASEWPVELESLAWRPGMTLYIEGSPTKWLIEEAWKNFETKTTECLLVSLNEQLSPDWNWSSDDINFNELDGYPYEYFD